MLKKQIFTGYRLSISSIVMFGITMHSSVSAQTAMDTLAESMSPGTWAELATTGEDAALAAHDSILEFSDEMVWDSVNRRALFLGTSDPNGPGGYAFVQYSAATNTWSRLPFPSFGSTTSPNHAYKLHAIDNARGVMWYMPFSATLGNFFEFNLSTDTWRRRASQAGVLSYIQSTSTISYFPERGTVVLHSGDVSSNQYGDLAEYNPNNDSWTQIPNARTAPAGGIHPVMEYSRAHGVIWFGGGDSTNAMWRLSANGSVTPSAPTPSGLNMNVQQSLMTVDPVSGNFLVLGSNSEFWEYDPSADSWTRLPDGAPPFTNPHKNPIMFHTVATPVDTYGVVMIAQYRLTGSSKVWLYKHSPSIADRVAPEPPLSLIVE